MGTTLTVSRSNGHYNVLVRDHDSIITHFGKHDRVVAFLPDSEGLYCRVDHVWGLGMPTAAQVLDVARKNQGVRGRWSLVRTEDWTYNGKEATDFHFKRGEIRLKP